MKTPDELLIEYDQILTEFGFKIIPLDIPGYRYENGTDAVILDYFRVPIKIDPKLTTPLYTRSVMWEYIYLKEGKGLAYQPYTFEEATPESLREFLIEQTKMAGIDTV